MATGPTLAAQALEAAAPAVGRSLRLRGFIRRDDGYWRRTGDFEQTVRLDAVTGRDPSRAGLRVILRLVSVSEGPGEPQSRIELPLWDLIPGRERGGSWVVTPLTQLGAVTADLVAQLERHGLTWLDRMTALPATTSGRPTVGDGFLSQPSGASRFLTRVRWMAADRSIAGLAARHQ